MPESILIRRFRQRLWSLGYPVARLPREVQEMADHLADLKEEALDQGLSEAAAEAQAGERLGDPVVLADRLAVALRRSSWWGRHPITSFCLLPPLEIYAALLLSVAGVLGLLRLSLSPGHWASLADGGRGFELMAAMIRGVNFLTITLAAWWSQHLARRSLCGIKWAVVACAVCAVCGLFSWVGIRPHSFFVGFVTIPKWPNPVSAVPPLLIAGAVLIRQRRMMARAVGPSPL